MIMLFLIFFSFMYVVGIMSFVNNRKHLLSMLLSLEYIVLCLFLMLFMYLMYMSYELYFSMMYLVFSVCEGALGLSILVSIVRMYSSDYFQSFSIL